MKKFLLQLTAFTFFVAILDYCWIRFTDVSGHIPFVWFMLAFFSSATALSHYFSIRASKGKPQVFIRFYMGSTALRLFLYLILIMSYRFYDKPTLVPFAIGFMAHYLLFTVFEVPLLLKELKNS